MRKLLSNSAYAVIAVLPVLSLTSGALSALCAGAAVLISMLLMFAVTLGVPTVIPEKVKTPVLLIAAALGVSIAQIILLSVPQGTQAGIYMPLCCVSVLLLFRKVEAGAVIPRLLSTVRLGGVYLVLITLIGCVRELLGAGRLFGISVTEKLITPMSVFVFPAGAIFIAAVLIAVFSYNIKEENDDA